MEHTGSAEDLIIDIDRKFIQFKNHSFVNKILIAYFENRKTDLTKYQIVIQMDFAKNYSTVYQDEILSAHWSHGQVTIFTCYVSSSNCVESFAIVSDNLSP